ncbi:MAG: methylmalonyl Co-A mutase-associated GTPase MeaB [Planctomycetes bacterium]|nr:methylmalonyl Co-A mutase-associated GTPase MeaB [Planctomycetota bacterium]
MTDLISRVAAGDTRALARALTLAENRDGALLAALDLAARPSPWRIGVTGPPGAGKSTLVSALVRQLRDQGAARLAVVAVDPSSPYSGGALLGDRLRMAEHTLDPGVYVRSMAARGHFGGLAAGCEDVCDLLALAGHDPVIVETVGVGQSEVEVAGVADTTLVVLTPSAGDSVQALKAGIMEVADVIAINKADRPGADRLEEDIKEGLDLRPHPAPGAAHWRPPIVRTVATQGQGIAELGQALAAHVAHLRGHNLLGAMASRRALARLDSLALEAIGAALKGDGALAQRFAALRARVAAGQATPRAAVAELLAGLDK